MKTQITKGKEQMLCFRNEDGGMNDVSNLIKQLSAQIIIDDTVCLKLLESKRLRIIDIIKQKP